MAASLFSQVITNLSAHKWNLSASALLGMHADCLRKLGRKDEYVYACLEILTLAATSQRSKSASWLYGRPDLHSSDKSWAQSWSDDSYVDYDGYLNQLIDFLTQLPYTVTVDARRVFDDIHVDPYIQHCPEKDGFKMQVRLRHVLAEEALLDCATVVISSMSPMLTPEISLRSDGPIRLKPGLVDCEVTSNVSTLGVYKIDRVILEFRNLSFVYETVLTDETGRTGGKGDSNGQPVEPIVPNQLRVLCYPSAESLVASITLPRRIYLDKTKMVEVLIDSGRNSVQAAEICLRGASAGLRLHTARVQIIEGNALVTAKSQPGEISPRASLRIVQQDCQSLTIWRRVAPNLTFGWRSLTPLT